MTTPGQTYFGTPGSTPVGPVATTMGGSNENKSVDAISNLLGWYQEREEEGRPCELEIFVSGGGFNYKKACLDVSKLQDAGQGIIMVRVNTPVDMISTYTVHIPKKLA